MLQILLAAFLFVYCLTFLLIRMLFREKILLEKRLKSITATSIETRRLEEDILNKPFAQRVVQPLIFLVSKVFYRFTPSKSRLQLQKTLELAGNPGNLKPYEFQSLQLFFVLVCMVVVGSFLSLNGKALADKVLLLALTAITANLLVKVYLNSRIRKRKAEFLKQLPDALDLLTVSVEAGLGFDSALLHVVEKSKGALAEEFRITIKELQMGKSRREALKDLGERTNVDDILTFVGAMIQADQLGVPITRILRTQAEQVRTRRRQRVEEKAMKAPIKMLIPLVFFIFPSIFIVLLGPAAIQIYQLFAQGF